MLRSDGSQTVVQFITFLKHLEYFVIIDLDRISSEKVCQLYILQAVDAYVTIGQLVHAREDTHLGTGLFTYIEDLFSVFRGSRRHRKNNRTDVVFGCFFHNNITAADDRNTVELSAVLSRVIVDDADSSRRMTDPAEPPPMIMTFSTLPARYSLLLLYWLRR